MLISCEKCSTSYKLDDRMVPVGGAPVQCTRCGYVFLAKVGTPAEEAMAPSSPRTPTPPFGTPAVSLPQAMEPRRSTTQVFGAVRSVPPSEDAPAPASSEEMATPPKAAASKTMVFGAISAGTPARQAKTQLFALGTSPGGEVPVEASPVELANPSGGKPFQQTQRFALSEVVALREPEGVAEGNSPPMTASAPLAQSAAAGEQPTPVVQGPLYGAGRTHPGTVEGPRATQVFGAVGAGSSSSPEGLEPRKSNPAHDVLDMATRPTVRRSRSMIAAMDASEAAFRAQLGRRNRVVRWVALGLTAVIIAFAGYRLVAGRRGVTPEMQAARDKAMFILRKDDRTAHKEAAEALDALVTRSPDYVEAQAARVIALAFQLDDSKLALRRFQAESDELSRRIARLKEARAPGDWQNKVNALIDQLGRLKERSDPLVDQTTGLDERTNEAFKALMSIPRRLTPEEELSRTQAQAVYYAVKGASQAIELSERYRQGRQGVDDGWAAMAMAEYVANARVSPAAAAESKMAMEQLRVRDTTLLRAYVLEARAALSGRQYRAAVSVLDQLLLLNPRHETAQLLLGWIKAIEEGTASPIVPLHNP